MLSASRRSPAPVPHAAAPRAACEVGYGSGPPLLSSHTHCRLLHRFTGYAKEVLRPRFPCLGNGAVVRRERVLHPGRVAELRPADGPIRVSCSCVSQVNRYKSQQVVRTCTSSSTHNKMNDGECIGLAPLAYAGECGVDRCASMRARRGVSSTRGRIMSRRPVAAHEPHLVLGRAGSKVG